MTNTPRTPDQEDTREPLMDRAWFKASNYSMAIGGFFRHVEGTKRSAPLAEGERELGWFVLPPFQRPPAWDEAQKVRFIESIWGGLPLGAIVYNRPPMGGFMHPYDNYLLDGQQRVTAILDYTSDKFKVGGYLWSELTRRDQRHFEMLPMATLEAQIDDLDKLKEVYDRLAYGGTPHDPKPGVYAIGDFHEGDEVVVRGRVRVATDEFKKPFMTLWPVSPDDVLKHTPAVVGE